MRCLSAVFDMPPAWRFASILGNLILFIFKDPHRVLSVIGAHLEYVRKALITTSSRKSEN